MAADHEERPTQVDDEDLEHFERAFRDALSKGGDRSDLDSQLSDLPQDHAPVPQARRRRRGPLEADETVTRLAAPSPVLDGLVEAIARLEERLDGVEQTLEEMASRRTVVRSRQRPSAPEAGSS